MPPLPPDLTGPVRVALAKSEDAIPGPARLPGGCVYEPKWDGFRLVVVAGESVRLWSRQGVDLTDRFPDVAHAAGCVPAGTVVDGEVVAWNGDRLDFDLLQRRLVTAPTKARELRKRHPASFVAFDVLARDGVDLRRKPWRARRRALEELTADWCPPLQLTPATSDAEEARMWFDELRPMGVEGLVVKGEATPYRGGMHDWIKVKSRATTEVIVGGVIGRLKAPEAIVAGRMQDGHLRMVGRTVALSSKQSEILAAVLEPPTGDHPWPDEISPGFGGRGTVPLTKVEPWLVVEVAADAAMQGGKYRHPLRFVRVRADLAADDLATSPVLR